MNIRAMSCFLVAALAICMISGCDSEPTGPSGSTGTEWIYVSEKDSSGVTPVDRLFRINPNATGSGTAKVLDSARLITSPRAGKIAYLLEDRSNLFRILTANLDGSNAREVARSTSLDNALSYPVLSRDASKIVYTTADHRLVLMNADGSDPRVLHSDAEYEGIPDFSHDGKRLAFYGADNQLYVINVDGTNLKALAFGIQSDLDGRSKLEFSPNDSTIVYVGKDTSGQVDIYTVPTDGSAAPRKLTDDLNGDADPTWSPDGRRIAWSGFPADIYIINADGTGRRVLSPGTSYTDFSPNWSPDGGRILYTSQLASGSVRSEVGSLKMYNLNTNSSDIIAEFAYRGFWGKY